MRTMSPFKTMAVCRRCGVDSKSSLGDDVVGTVTLPRLAHCSSVSCMHHGQVAPRRGVESSLVESSRVESSRVEHSRAQSSLVESTVVKSSLI